MNADWNEPENDDIANVWAADRNMQFFFGWFTNPIFGDGDYPSIMIEQVHFHRVSPDAFANEIGTVQTRR